MGTVARTGSQNESGRAISPEWARNRHTATSQIKVMGIEREGRRKTLKRPAILRFPTTSGAWRRYAPGRKGAVLQAANPTIARKISAVMQPGTMPDQSC